MLTQVKFQSAVTSQHSQHFAASAFRQTSANVTKKSYHHRANYTHTRSTSFLVFFLLRCTGSHFVHVSESVHNLHTVHTVGIQAGLVRIRYKGSESWRAEKTCALQCSCPWVGQDQCLVHSPKALLLSLRCQAQSSVAICDIFLISHSLTQLRHTKVCNSHSISVLSQQMDQAKSPVSVAGWSDLVRLVKQDSRDCWSVLQETSGEGERRKEHSWGKIHVYTTRAFIEDSIWRWKLYINRLLLPSCRRLQKLMAANPG